MAVRNDGIDTGALDLLLEKVYRDRGYDFRGYRRGTLIRRLERRLRSAGANTCLDYMRFLDAHPDEYQLLLEDITIKTSDFFRNPYTYQQVANLVLPELVAGKLKRGDRRLTVWSAACARGEEPYSLAILLSEFLGPGLGEFNITVEATDISRRALEEARAGVYPAKNGESLPSRLMERYFSPCGGGFRVGDNIRPMLRFSHCDLASVTEAPFENLDFIFCRNLLIYMRVTLQERVLNLLYDSLAVSGYLVLGEVETLPNSLREKYECLDAKARIYKKKVLTEKTPSPCIIE